MKKTDYRLIVVMVLLVLGLIAVGVWLIPAIRTAATDLATRKAEVAAYQEQVDALKKASIKLESAGEAGGIPITEANLKKAIPEHRDYEDLYAMIENMAQISGVNAPISISITSAADSTAAAVTETPISVTASGSYGAVKDFIKNMQTSLRPLALKSVDLAPNEDGSVTVSISASTYTREMNTATTTTTTNGGIQ